LEPAAAAEVERGAYNAAISFACDAGGPRLWTDASFAGSYLRRVHAAARALQPGSYAFNAELRGRLDRGELPPAEVARMAPEEAWPEVWRDAREALRSKEQRAMQPRLTMTSTRFRCPRCRKAECSYYELQIRSGDEASTFFVTCVACEHKWRVG
jgi:DNA-directed RNA polymerase subunit M/transcription elongation factor TFIIS